MLRLRLSCCIFFLFLIRGKDLRSHFARALGWYMRGFWKLIFITITRL